MRIETGDLGSLRLAELGMKHNEDGFTLQLTLEFLVFPDKRIQAISELMKLVNKEVQIDIIEAERKQKSNG